MFVKELRVIEKQKIKNNPKKNLKENNSEVKLTVNFNSLYTTALAFTLTANGNSRKKKEY